MRKRNSTLTNKRTIAILRAMKLSDWLKSKGITAKEFAERLNVTPPTISRIVNEKSEPSIGLAVKIQAATRGKVKITDLTL